MKGSHPSNDDNDSFLVMILKFSKISGISDQSSEEKMTLTLRMSPGRPESDSPLAFIAKVLELGLLIREIDSTAEHVTFILIRMLEC